MDSGNGIFSTPRPMPLVFEDYNYTAVVLKLGVATPWCVVLLFKGRRKIIWIAR